MPSSISNSEIREAPPGGAWGRTWALAAVLTIAILGGYEAASRYRGFKPAVHSETAAWMWNRGAVKSRSTILVGTSRIQGGFDPAVWASTTGERSPIMLALPGGSPLPILLDLAEEPSFAGLVIVDVLPRVVFEMETERDVEANAMVQAFREWRTNPARQVEDRLRLVLLSPLAFRSPALSLENLALSLRAWRFPEPYHVRMRRDRFASHVVPRDAERRERGFYRQYATKGRAATPAEADSLIGVIRVAAQRIRSRGGQVVLVHMPHCRSIQSIEEQRYPRARYWDRMVEALEPTPAIHFADEPSLTSFCGYEGSHLTKEDAARFTVALVRVIERELRGSGPP